MNYTLILRALSVGYTYTRGEAGASEQITVLKGMAELPNCPDWVAPALAALQPALERERRCNWVYHVENKWGAVRRRRTRVGIVRHRRRRRHQVRQRHAVIRRNSRGGLCRMRGKPFPIAKPTTQKQ